MTTVELMKNVGRTAKWGDGTGLEYLVTITDSRLRWGRWITWLPPLRAVVNVG